MPTDPWAPEMFPDRADHYVITEGQGRTGTMKPVVPTTPTASAVPCSVQEMTPLDGPAAVMAIQSRIDTGIYYPADPVLTANDQVKIPATGRIYVVVGVVKPPSPQDILWMAQCRRMGS